MIIVNIEEHQQQQKRHAAATEHLRYKTLIFIPQVLKRQKQTIKPAP